MKYLVIVAVTGFVMMVVVGCARGASNTPSGSAERATTAEQTTSIHRIPVEKDKYRGGATSTPRARPL